MKTATETKVPTAVPLQNKDSQLQRINRSHKELIKVLDAIHIKILALC